ncbi:MAG: TolC family protein [Planctomycetales bacterium]|nr:TolC family protein [Planctomycetales bacterium]
MATICAALFAAGAEAQLSTPQAPRSQPSQLPPPITAEGTFPLVASHEEMLRVNRRLEASDDSHDEAEPGWWCEHVVHPISDGEPLMLSLEQVLIAALTHSRQVQVFSELPLIRETAITEASAAFDWSTFIDTRWDDRSDPIGSTLTAGPGATRFRDHQLALQSGLRRRTTTGAQLQMQQQLGHQANNSQFFVPNPQGTSRMTLNFTQPLLRGRGKVYNNSLIVLATIDKEVANDEFRRQLELHLLETSRAYWALYLERAVLYQKTNSYLRGKRVLDRLQQRRGLDAQESQIVSAEAAIKQRQAELTRARAAVRNAESRLRALVNDPGMLGQELIPADAPRFDRHEVELEEVVRVAFQQRPEVAQAVKQVRAACVRMEMSKHEMLPLLNLVTEAYVAGLEDRGRVFDAWARQFDTGEPGYGIGLQYEVPVHRRAAKARLQRRRLELRQLESQYASTLETVRLEAEVAVRELLTAQNELSTKLRAMRARELQLRSLALRWSSLPGEDVSSSLALENLLHAQERLADAEYEYLKAQLTFNLAFVNLKRAAGLLMQHEEVVVGRAVDCGLPRQVLDKPDLTLEEINPIPALLMPPVDGGYNEEVHVAPTGPDYLNFGSAANSAVQVPAVRLSSPPSALPAEATSTIHFGNITPLIR